jgi:hypothetical protein
MRPPDCARPASLPAFSRFDAARLLAILQYLAVLFFVAGGLPFLAGRWQLRRLAIIAYGCALAAALAWVAVWLTSSGRSG